MMLDSLTHDKNQIIQALKSLPASVKLPTDERVSELSEIRIAEGVAQDIANLNEYWEFINSYHDMYFIAMIGMVNAGKSALGNHLLHQGESGIFEEAPVRETAKASQAQLEQKIFLIDLPGLGSVLSQEDDKIVKNIIRRANVLLVVIGVNQPITQHLYDFLKSEEVLKTWDAQRIIIILNKLDILDNFPEAHRKKQLDSFSEFLIKGNSKMGFPGIGKLFDYQIPIIPFSVVHTRNGKEQWREDALRNAISIALTDSANGCLLRAKQELVSYCRKYITLVVGYIAIKNKIVELANSLDSSFSRMIDDMKRIVSRETDSLYEIISNTRDGCFDAMKTYQPDSAESFWKGSNYESKKNGLRTCRDRYKSKMCIAFDNFATNIKDALVMVVQGTFGSCHPIYQPDKDKVYESLNSLVSNIWDVFDDVYFLDYSSDSYRVRQKLERQNSHLESIAAEVTAWKEKLIERVLEAAKKASQSGSLGRLEKYNSACSSLAQFIEIFTETEVFQQLVSDQ
ncbi:GTPase [Aerosakkonema funiforme]|uniref:GTPase n=1 Tax=Aerosakkonema funiforme TaxID=1246630 RepID=UPI0035B7E803